MLALRRGPRLLGLLPAPRPAARACSSRAPSGPGNPLVYLDVGADGQPLGRVVLEVRPRVWTRSGSARASAAGAGLSFPVSAA